MTSGPCPITSTDSRSERQSLAAAATGVSAIVRLAANAPPTARAAAEARIRARRVARPL